MSVFCQSGHENVDGSFFCEICGELLTDDSAIFKVVRVCPNCGSVNQPEAERCALCDTLLTSGAESVTGGEGDSDHDASARHPRLIVLADMTTFDIVTTNDVIIGRADPTCDIYPDIDLTQHGGEDGGVSRIHARLRYEGGHCTVEDQKSINYTFLNKQRLEAFTPTAIKHGDELRLGRVVLRFELVES
jgi:hypothetical protein